MINTILSANILKFYIIDATIETFLNLTSVYIHIVDVGQQLKNN